MNDKKCVRMGVCTRARDWMWTRLRMIQQKTTAIHFAFVLWKQIKASSKIYGFAKNMRDFNGLVFNWISLSLSLSPFLSVPEHNITAFSMAMQKNEYLNHAYSKSELEIFMPTSICVHSICLYIYVLSLSLSLSPHPRSTCFMPDRICICELLAIVCHTTHTYTRSHSHIHKPISMD